MTDFVSFRGKFVPKPKEMKNFIDRLSGSSTSGSKILFALVILSIVTACKQNDSDLSSQQPLLSGPITSEEITMLEKEFDKTYSALGGLNSAILKVEISDTLINEIERLAAVDNKGLVFYYGYLENKKEICYLIGLGNQDPQSLKFEHYPFPKRPGLHPAFFLVFSSNDNYLTPVGANTFVKLTEAYKKNITQNKTSISSNMDHPLMVYHQGKELKKFYDEYKLGSPLYLHIANGSGLTSQGIGTYQVPIILFGNDQVPFPTDDINYVARGLNEPYRNKALDAGHVCPPHCLSILPQE